MANQEHINLLKQGVEVLVTHLTQQIESVGTDAG